MRIHWLASIGLAVAVLVLACGAERGAANEVDFGGYKYLDQFEAHQLQKADKAFAAKKYRQAGNLYNQFILEFPRSEAVPYALMRKGRCLQHDNKKYKAVTEYEEVLDYFPNVVEIAAPSLYYKGESYMQAQDYEKAMKAWAKMVADKEYRKHPLAGKAYLHLANNMLKLARNKEADFAEAIGYYEKAIVEFYGKLHHNERRKALDQIRFHYFRRAPNEEAFREFYRKSGGAEWRRRRKVPEKLAEDWEYWKDVRRWVWDRDINRFDDHQKAERKDYFSYWADVLEPHFPGNDGFQIDVAKMAYYGGSGKDKYYARMQDIFEARRTAENHNNRIIGWIEHLRGHSPEIAKYVEKVDWKSMDGALSKKLLLTLAEIKETGLAKTVYPKIPVEKLPFGDRWDLLRTIYEKMDDKMMAENVYNRMGLKEQKDKTKASVGDWFSSKSEEELALRSYAVLDDEDLANYKRLLHYHKMCTGHHALGFTKKRYAKGIENGEKAATVAKYAKDAWWKVAELHEKAKDWEKAILAYRNTQGEPDSLFEIAECFKNWGKLQNAIQQLSEIESFFKKEKIKSEAAWVQSTYYRAFNKLDHEKEALYRIMHAYPGSNASSRAHERLEARGLPIEGAIGKKEHEKRREREEANK